MSAIFDFNYLDEEALEQLDKLEFSKKGSKRLCFHKDNNSDLHAMLIVLEKNTLYEAHRHERDEMIFLQEGKIKIGFEDKVIELDMTGRRLLIIEKGVIHSVQAGQDGATILEVIAHR